MVASVVASGFAASKAAAYYEKVKLRGDPIGFTPSDIRFAVELAIARFQLWILALTGPIYVGLNGSSTTNLLVTLVLSGIVSLGSLLLLHRIDSDDAYDSLGVPRNYAAWAELAGPARKYQVTKIDLWSGFIVLVNVFLALS